MGERLDSPAAQAIKLRHALGIVGAPTAEDAWRLAALFGEALEVMESTSLAAFLCVPERAVIILPTDAPNQGELFVLMLAHAVLHWHRQGPGWETREGEPEGGATRHRVRQNEADHREAQAFAAAWYQEQSAAPADAAHG